MFLFNAVIIIDIIIIIVIINAIIILAKLSILDRNLDLYYPYTKSF